MIVQAEMIERLRDVCLQDERLVAAMLYGSVPQEEADDYSDVDCVLFFDDQHLARIDQASWIGQIAPVDLYYTNEFGNGVAIFRNLVRGEFHFDAASTMAIVETWRDAGTFPSVEAALLLDRTGQLTRHLETLTTPAPARDTPDTVRFLYRSFLNWSLLGVNVLARGEFARALEVLVLLHDYLLRMARVLEGSTRHWMTPTRALEKELSEAAYARYKACTAAVDREPLAAAYLAAWRWGNELMSALADAQGLSLPEPLIEKLDDRVVRYTASEA